MENAERIELHKISDASEKVISEVTYVTGYLKLAIYLMPGHTIPRMKLCAA